MNANAGYRIAGLMLALMLVAASSPTESATAPGYPNKPIRLIVGASSMAVSDVAMRIVGESLAAALGQPIVVDNRPGAITTIGLAAVAKAAPDGHTVGMLTLQSTVAPSLLLKMPYDTLRDLAPVRHLSWSANILVIRSGAPVASLSELAAAAKARPGRLTFASGGNGTPSHLIGEFFKLHTALDIQHVPFKGGLAGVTAVIGEHVDLMFAPGPAVAPHVRAGKLRALATSAPTRLGTFPDVPTLVELGFTGLEVRDWNGMVAPRATPGPVIARLAAELTKVLARPEVKDRLAIAGMEPVTESGPAEFGTLIRSELARWANVVRVAGIRAD